MQPELISTNNKSPTKITFFNPKRHRPAYLMEVTILAIYNFVMGFKKQTKLFSLLSSNNNFEKTTY
jgi:hypothetical protein